MIAAKDYPILKRAYDLAVKDEQPIFTFKDHQLVTDYAKYLLEYLKPEYERIKNQ